MNNVRLRKKPWVKDAILDYGDFVRQDVTEEAKGKWADDFGRTAPLHVELGCGKGDFITGMAARHPEITMDREQMIAESTRLTTIAIA